LEADFMKRFPLFAVLLCALAPLVSGCGREGAMSPTSPGATSSDQQTFSNMIDQEPALAEGGTYETPGESEFPDGYAVGSGASADVFSTADAIRPVYFFRVIRERSREIDIHIDEDTAKVIAHVDVTDHFAGSFNIVTVDSTDAGLVRHLTKKPLRDIGRFRAVFARWKKPSPDDPDAPEDPARTIGDWTRWHLVGISGREIHSPDNTARILSVHLQTEAGLDTTIEDPLALWRFPRGLLRIPANTRVKVTVKTQDPTDAVFLLAGWGHQRLRPTADGFVGGFRSPYETRLFRFGVNALDHGTLFNDQAPYDSDFWGIPARTVVPALAAN
jgi:hypothetical protein